MSRSSSALGLVVAVLLLVGCGQADQLSDEARAVVGDARAAVDDARTRVEGLAAQADDVRARFEWCRAAADVASAVAREDLEAVTSAAQDLRSVVPEELTQDLDTVLDAVAGAQGVSDDALLADDVRDAGSDLLDTAIEQCGVRS